MKDMKMKFVEVLKLFALILVVFASSFIVGGCSKAELVIVRAADIVDEVALRGDQIDAVSVELCDQAEQVALTYPDVDAAEAAISEIRKRCDQAFKAIDKVAETIAVVDSIFAEVEQGEDRVTDLVEAALAARKLFISTKLESDQLNEFLNDFIEKANQ